MMAGFIRRTITIAVIMSLGICTAPVCAVAAVASHPRVERLTQETYDEAVACGRSGGDCAVTPYLVCPSQGGRFSSYIATPFSRVAASVFDALKAGLPVRPMGQNEANGWGLGIYVMPGPNQRLADSIQKVLIRRGEELIEPLTTTIAPAVYRGGNPPLLKGFFTFPMNALAPSSSVTVVLIGASGTTNCSFDQRQLETLR